MLDKNTVVALGYFDSVHKGHLAVIERAKSIAEKTSANLMVFTFSGNLKKALGFNDGTNVFTPEERRGIFESLGVSNVIYAPTTVEFLSLTAGEFLDYLNSKGKISCYVCGEDYRFGAGGKGDINFIKEYAKNHSQTVEIVDTFTSNNQKISTTLIKQYLSAGEIQKANDLLGRNFFLTGVVSKGRGVGKRLGFPTANVEIPQDKARLKNAVYYGYITVDGFRYKAMINYGAKPTFGLKSVSVEGYLDGFSGDLYGKEVKVELVGLLREIKDFGDKDKLAHQLQLDLQKIREIDYD